MCYINDKISYRNAIRNYMRTIRRTVNFRDKYIAAQLITNKIMAIDHIYRSTHIAIYISNDGEIDTRLLINTLLFAHKKIYLPVLPNKKSKKLLFLRYTLSTSLVRNRLNIYEPQWNIHAVLPIENLNIIFVPLVAFDCYGNRLGMGGGFYDKTLQNWKYQNNYIPIGLAYDFQKIPTQLLPIEKWDITLPEIITPSYHMILH